MPPRAASGRLLPYNNPSQTICFRCLLQQRSFSSSPSHGERKNIRKPTRAQRQMLSWLHGPGAVFEQPLKGSTNYLGAYDKSGTLIRGRSGATSGRNESEESQDSKNDKASESAEGEEKGAVAAETLNDLVPFPLNPYFRSEAVLSEDLRSEIYRRMKELGQTVREVSVSLSVTMERCAAVYRMKEIEARRVAEKRPLYLEYQQTVMGMLPQTKYDPKAKSQPRHESINDLPVHPSTLTQLFHPTTESRHFTRVDAGKVFHPNLKPADERIPHPEMIEAAKDNTEGYTQSERTTRMKDRYEQMEEATKEKVRRRQAAEAQRTTTVEGKRWDFKFKDISADVVSKNGRSRSAAGWRYGQPYEDRKKGQVKIPTRVD